MGRANAGKTTILQRVCNATDQPEIFNGEGQKACVDNHALTVDCIQRGYHDIEDELVFRSNPRFVFHDSCGFEAGSEEQFAMMKKFVMDHARTPKLNKRIHAIWFCIPLTDIHRMVTAAETKFFEECDTGHVPVVVLVTKADALELEAIEQLEDQGLTVDATSVAALEKKILDNNIAKLKGWLNKCKFAPQDYLSFGGMHEESGDCTSLLKCTTNALTEEGLQELLISTQQTNLGLCIEFAILQTLKVNMKMGWMNPAGLAFELSKWFPFKVCEMEYLVGLNSCSMLLLPCCWPKLDSIK
ncbi:hypothetical protein F5J12DRAFT_943389 [Pisolithus orientalis]|uniref:uncharacterized protein n=1 Tax=Pisolithus orientalis TaxID=936130 RepID=UPI002224C706|nr:uncharacterized protein F5J12DRAFT_943389 [Pisolithus orientalis]KAI6003495.1 hypothetical protein F5J12DRAFT_943389 [Pisolithus orientalis]